MEAVGTEEELTTNREEEEGNGAVADTTVEQETNGAEEMFSTVVEASGIKAPKKVFCVERGCVLFCATCE